MNEVDALEKLLDSKLSLLMQRLDGQDRTLERIEGQTTKTNGRVTFLERAWERLVTQIKGHERAIREIKRNRPEDVGEERNVRFWMVGGVIATIIATIAVLSFFGRLK